MCRACLDSQTRALFSRLCVEEANQELVVRFFIWFSRLEYALKSDSRYLKKGPHNRAEVNWRGFTVDKSGDFDPSTDIELKEAVNFLLQSPPRQQIEGSTGKLEWCERHYDEESDLGKVIEVIKQVRNNLFHGGKCGRGNGNDSARNGDLLRHSLTVLEHILELDDRVQGFFWEA
jgi:hypothetical protein